MGDIEVGLKDHKIRNIESLGWDGTIYHSANKRELMNFSKDVDFVCGHNIINHDVYSVQAWILSYNDNTRTADYNPEKLYTFQGELHTRVPPRTGYTHLPP